jgi:transposase
VGVDLGDQWSHYCILDLEGETLAEGQLRTTPQDVAEFFQALNAARVVLEVGPTLPGCRKSSAVAGTKSW